MQQSGTSAGTVSSTSADSRHMRDPRREAVTALQFWQALEYIAPQEPPKIKVQDCVWEIATGAPPEAMPWADPEKMRFVNRKPWKNKAYQLFAGIVDGPYLVETARAFLGAPMLDHSERMPPAPAACVVLNVNELGHVDGEVFVSALPWAMAKLASNRYKSGPIDFKGFFGPGHLEEHIRKAVTELLFERKLIAKDNLDNATDSSPIAEEEKVVPLPVSPADLKAIADLVFVKGGWVPEVQAPCRVQAFRARDHEKKHQNPPAEDPLNSFYAEDLERVRDAFDKGDLGAGLSHYLAGADAPDRIDLDCDRQALIDGVHPSLQPRGCWPSAHPLVTAQQFAVNTAIRELSQSDGIFAVNGPPGTGKTTMLKDIAAAVLVQRADVLAEFDNPAAAFSGEVHVEGEDWPAALIDERLRGFGIVVASANNGAVENISKQFPGRAAISPEFALDYFAVVADSVAMDEHAKLRDPVSSHWGLFAAVLGNMGNRKLFAQRFWFEGYPKKARPDEPPEPLHPHRLRGLQELRKTNEDKALPWAEARKRYRAAITLVDSLTARMEAACAAAACLADANAAHRVAESAIQAVQADLPRLVANAQAERLAHESKQTQLHAIEERHALAKAREKQARRTDSAARHLAQLADEHRPGERDTAEADFRRAEMARNELRVDYDSHRSNPPGLLAQLFRTQASQQWTERNLHLEFNLDKARADARDAYARLQRLQVADSAIERARKALAAAHNRLQACHSAAVLGGVRDGDMAAALLQHCELQRQDLEETQRRVAHADQALASSTERECQLTRILGDTLLRMRNAEDELGQLGIPVDRRASLHLSSLAREQLHRTAPYFCAELFDARRAVFCAALDLHKSFIAAAWPQLRKSLSVFVSVLTGSIHPDKIAGGVAQLWDAFFLVVPLVSTTFASFPRLFNGMGRESLAWLLIDEAGQAAPQQAVGAIWRARRTILVGDPRQLEPVVGVPEELIGPLLERCGAERQWAPPQASVQTLADRANRYGMYIAADGEQIWLGAPLLVHRRCLDPMFAIANRVAYNDKMVYGSGSDSDSEEPGIGSSCWFDVPGEESEGHWIQAQADQALDLVRRTTQGELRDAEGRFKVYIVTPFRAVSKKINEQLAMQYPHDRDACKGMAGTVHTFQGKEADYVIFLLGGDPKHPGVIARFAGKKPNLVNVAVTRARRRLYVVGDHAYWTGKGDVKLIFSRMAEHLRIEKVDRTPNKRESREV